MVNQALLLNEMGIEQYLPRAGAKIHAPTRDKIALQASAKLLLVGESKPTSEETEYLQKILSTLSLELSHVAYIDGDDFPDVELSSVEWVWFCGAAKQSTQDPSLQDKRLLDSPSLSTIMGSNDHRRALWAQIKQQKSL